MSEHRLLYKINDVLVDLLSGSRAKRSWNRANEAEAEQGELRQTLRPMTLHECRHTFASFADRRGGQPQGDSGVHGTRHDRGDVLSVRALDAGSAIKPANWQTPTLMWRGANRVERVGNVSRRRSNHAP